MLDDDEGEMMMRGSRRGGERADQETDAKIGGTRGTIRETVERDVDRTRDRDHGLNHPYDIGQGDHTAENVVVTTDSDETNSTIAEDTASEITGGADLPIGDNDNNDTRN